ncbi:MAG: YeiH family protein [Acidimicrobiia bacterium]
MTLAATAPYWPVRGVGIIRAVEAGPPAAGVETDGSSGSVRPGLVLVAAGVAVAVGLHHLVEPVSPLIAAAVLGVLATNLGLVPEAARPGLDFAAKRLLRLGVVLLGLQLSFAEASRLGWVGVVAVVAVVVATFVGTRWLGRRLGVSRGLSLLTATGFSICGASAIAAMQGVAGEDEDDVAFALALVTVFGTAAIVVLPLVGHLLGLGPTDFGVWVGASVHDIAQVVATSSTGGADALRAAVVVKLTRVLALAPMVALAGARRRARAGSTGAVRPPLVPGFVVAFVAMVLVRNTGAVPEGVLDAARSVETVLMAAALVGLGAGVDVRRLRRTGPRPLVLGATSWVLVAGLALASTLATRPFR